MRRYHRKRPTRRVGVRIALALSVVGLMALGFLLYEPLPYARTQPPAPLDVTGKVQASNCAPCHVRIAEAKQPGLIFTHGNHLMVACESCHYEFPHQAGKTYSPPMESCFACHGVSHGATGELASKDCDACHTPSFPLRPRSHTKDWAKKPHAERGKQGGVNYCMMCHDAPKDCDACHRDEGVDVGPMPPAYQSVVPVVPDRPSVRVFPAEGTDISQCYWCHPDIDAFKPDRVIFTHETHMEQNIDCGACHPDFGHGVEQIRIPDMKGCYRCHGLQHAASGLVAGEECEKCHPKDFELKPPNHTLAFETGKHKELANKDPEYCSMCHQPEFCTECHRGGKRLANGKESTAVIPADHRKGEWQSQHGGLYLGQKGACGSCHDSDSCKRCHQTVMPHPPDWLDQHSRGGRSAAQDCNVCHTDRDRCQQCHHDKVKRAELVAKNCVPCHDEMKQLPATTIENKGFAEHAVHFDVEEKKGKPYKCYECHVSFGSSKSAQEISKLQGHDLRLCYECHGALDIQSRQIAPYEGRELCVRCHSDVGV